MALGERTAEVIVAEPGPDVERFASHRHAASWAAVCPGDDESAGKRRSGKTRKGDRWLRVALIEAANAVRRAAALELDDDERLVCDVAPQEVQPPDVRDVLVAELSLVGFPQQKRAAPIDAVEVREQELLEISLKHKLELALLDLGVVPAVPHAARLRRRDAAFAIRRARRGGALGGRAGSR